MKAIVSTKSGSPDVLQLKEVEKPQPAENEVLIKVHAATVTQGDVILRKMHPLLALPMRLFGIRRKQIPGHEFAGEIESVGKSVKQFKAGDRVFGTTTGLSVGANAEYICVPQHWTQGVLAHMPRSASYEEAATLPVGGMTALEILSRGNIQSGQKVLIYGASGSVGTYAVQLSKHYFYAEVTGVCSTANIELVKSLGAAQVIDYTREDLIQFGQTYDVVFDAVGKVSRSEVDRVLNDNGTYLSVQTTTKESRKNLSILIELFEKGSLKSIIDKRFPLELVPAAHEYVETGRKRGNIVISVVPESRSTL